MNNFCRWKQAEVVELTSGVCWKEFENREKPRAVGRVEGKRGQRTEEKGRETTLMTSKNVPPEELNLIEIETQLDKL